MSGEIWIDATAERVTRLEGHLQQDTDYGFGVLGKLNKGGWIVLEQADMGGRQWRIARLKMQMNLRVLFKNKKHRHGGRDDPVCAGASKSGLQAGDRDVARRDGERGAS